MDKIHMLAQWLRESSYAVAFTGAGCSTESGLPDFRSPDGLYNQKYDYPPEQILSHSFFVRHTDEFFKFYRDKMLAPWAKPNNAHKKLAQLEQAGIIKSVITQNIDGLHQAAGSRAVYELHGSVNRNYCMKCHKFYPMDYVSGCSGVPLCECGGIVKPDVVLYEEGLDSGVINGAVNEILRSDLLIVAGTSLTVYPAAGLIDYFTGSRLVLINLGGTDADSAAQLVIHGRAGEVLGQITV